MAMKRKYRSTKVARGTAYQSWALDALHQIWLAGLGAASKAQRGAPQLFGELVAEGTRVQTKTRGVAQKAVRGYLTDVQSTIDTRIGDVRGRAADALENLEKIFQTRVHRVLTQLGVPSAEALTALSKRVDRLNTSVDRLSERRRPLRRRLGARVRRRVQETSKAETAQPAP